MCRSYFLRFVLASYDSLGPFPSGFDDDVRRAIGGGEDMVRAHSLDWQWSDYASKHRTRGNLLVHFTTVPVFQAGSLLLLYALFARSAVAGLVGFL